MNTYIILGTECRVCWYLYYPVFLFYFLVFNLTFTPDDFRGGASGPAVTERTALSFLLQLPHLYCREKEKEKERTEGTGSVGEW